LPTISPTVELTLKPAPLVGDPKFSPTVPIAHSIKNLCSRRTTSVSSRIGKILLTLKGALGKPWKTLNQEPFNVHKNAPPAGEVIGYERTRH